MDPTVTPPVVQPKLSTPTPGVRKKRWIVPFTIGISVIALIVVGWMLWTNFADQAEDETPTAAVEITDTGFNPATIRVKKGQDVTWTNRSSSAHQIVGDLNTPPTFRTDESLNQGDSYVTTFENSGTYNYHDPSNIDFKGIVVVE